MFRSFFICFLILSALTSKGAEVQINWKIADIPADMLPELFNAAFFHEDRHEEPSCAECERASYNKQPEISYTIEKQPGKILHVSSSAWIIPLSIDYFGYLQFYSTVMNQNPFCKSGINSCASDPSPPIT